MRLHHSLMLIFTLLSSLFFTATFTATAVTPEPQEPKPLAETHSPNDSVLRVVITPDNQTIPFGGTATFSFVVLNVSNSVNLVNVTVNSPLTPDCNRIIGNLAADTNFPSYQCSRMSVQTPFTNIVQAQGTNPINNQVSAGDDSAQVDIIDLNIVLDGSPDALSESGGLVDFSLPMLNTNGGNFTCSFSAEVNGQPDNYNIFVTAVATDENGNNIIESGSTIIRLSDVAANLDFALSASPLTVFEPTQSPLILLKNQNMFSTGRL